MNRTGSKPAFPQAAYDDIFSDDSAAIRKRQNEAQDFQSQLGSIISNNQVDDFKQLVQQQPQAWSSISPDDLAKWLLMAVKKGQLDMVDALVGQSAPGTAAAISLDMQLELVDAARLARNSEPEMNRLLDILLQAVDCPVQHLARLVQAAMDEKYFALAAVLSLYKAQLEKARNEQHLQSIYDAAAGGDTARLQKELDAKLGIPPLDDTLTGAASLFNMLHRWVMELFSKGTARALVIAPIGKLPLLHAAVESGNKETVLLLIEKGADLTTVDKDGHTALSKARDRKNMDMAGLLEKLQPPDRAPAPGGALASKQAPSGRPMVEGRALPQHESMADRPGYNDTFEACKNLLPEVASLLSKSEDLARELNHAEPMSMGQAKLFTAGYLAEFVPPEAVEGHKSRGALIPRTDAVLLQLRASREKFNAVGLKLEASKAHDIHCVLDNLTSTAFADLWTTPWDIEEHLKKVGLCNLLIASVRKAVEKSRGNTDWLSASDERRQEIFTACLRMQLRQLSKTRFAVKAEDPNLALFDQLLQRQIALLEKYCSAIDDARKAQAGQTTDFSDDFR